MSPANILYCLRWEGCFAVHPLKVSASELELQRIEAYWPLRLLLLKTVQGLDQSNARPPWP